MNINCSVALCFNCLRNLLMQSTRNTNISVLITTTACLVSCTCLLSTDRSIYPATCNPFEDGPLGVVTKCVVNEVLRLVTNSTAGCVYPTTNTVSTPQLDQHDIKDRVCRLFVHASLPRSACSSIDKFAKCRIDAQDVDSFACP